MAVQNRDPGVGKGSCSARAQPGVGVTSSVVDRFKWRLAYIRQSEIDAAAVATLAESITELEGTRGGED